MRLERKGLDMLAGTSCDTVTFAGLRTICHIGVQQTAPKPRFPHPSSPSENCVFVGLPVGENDGSWSDKSEKHMSNMQVGICKS